VCGAQRFPLGSFAPPFEGAVREALERHRNTLRRLELDGWVIESDQGHWIALDKIVPKRTPRKTPALEFEF